MRNEFREAPRPESASLETEQVREYSPRETPAAKPVLSGPGFAPAVPVKIEWPSDLQQVESDPDKTRVAVAEAVEPQPARRPKRVREPQAPVSEEPLVQIETGTQDAAPPSAGEKTPALPG